MYQFSGKLKMFSIALIVLGALGIGLGFYNAPSTVEEAMEMVASSDHGDGHGDENFTRICFKRRAFITIAYK